MEKNNQEKMMIAISEAENGNSKTLFKMLRQPDFDLTIADYTQKLRNKWGLKNSIDIGAIVVGETIGRLFID